MKNHNLYYAYYSKFRGLKKIKLFLMNLFLPRYTNWELYQMKNIGGRVYNIYAKTNELTGKMRYKKSRAKVKNKLFRHQ